jgi:hypothetical protein
MPKLKKLKLIKIQLKMVLEYLPGAIQAFSVITVGYPFDTVKSFMQRKSDGNLKKTVKKIYNSKGAKGFYRGASIPYLTLIVKRGIQFRIYEKIKKQYENTYLAGAGAAISMSWISSPMQNVKVNMQVNNKYKSVYHFIKTRYFAEGILGFYRGFKINFIRDISFGTVYLGTYGFLKNKFGNSYYSPFFAGGCSSVLTWCCLLPIDHAKTIIQTRKNTTITSVIRSTPLKSYWRSLSPTIIRIFPVTGTSMVIYEICKKFFD